MDCENTKSLHHSDESLAVIMCFDKCKMSMNISSNIDDVNKVCENLVKTCCNEYKTKSMAFIRMVVVRTVSKLITESNLLPREKEALLTYTKIKLREPLKLMIQANQAKDRYQECCFSFFVCSSDKKK